MAEAKMIQTRHSELLNQGIGRCDIAHLRDSCFIPDTISVNNCSLNNHDVIRDIDSLEVPFFASYFASGLTLPLHPFTRAVLTDIGICPCQGNANFYKIINCFIMLAKLIEEELKPADLFCTFMLNYEPKYNSLYFRRRTNAAELLSKLPTNDDSWDKYPLLVLGNWEFGSEARHPLAPRVSKTKVLDLAATCIRINDLASARGEPKGYRERVKKITKEHISKRNFEALLQAYSVQPGPMAVRSLPKENLDYTPIEAAFNEFNFGASECHTKRKLLQSNHSSISTPVEEPAPKKVALHSPIVNVVTEIDDSPPEGSLRHRTTKTIAPIIASSSQQCSGAVFSEDIGTSFAAVNAPIWVPSFGKDSNKVFLRESSLYHDQNDALDFLMGMRTPRDDIYLSSKDELTKHKLAQHHMVKASILLSSNNNFLESASKEFVEMKSLLSRLSSENKSLTSQNKELTDRKLSDDLIRKNLEQELEGTRRNWESTKSEPANIANNNIKLQNTISTYSNTINSLSAQLIEVEAHKNEAENQCAEVLTQKIDAEDRSAELQVALNNRDALCAELQAKLHAAHTEQTELLAHNAILQTKLDGATSFYQAVIDKEAKDYFIRGVKEGHQNCLNIYGLKEIDSDNDEDKHDNADLDTECVGDGR